MNFMAKKDKEKVIVKRKYKGKEFFGKEWQPVYRKNKPAMLNNRTKEVAFPSEAYIKKHHPRGAWDS